MSIMAIEVTQNTERLTPFYSPLQLLEINVSAVQNR